MEGRIVYCLEQADVVLGGIELDRLEPLKRAVAELCLSLIDESAILVNSCYWEIGSVNE